MPAPLSRPASLLLELLLALVLSRADGVAQLALKLVKFENVVYTDEEGYLQESEAKEKGLDAKKLSGTEFRRLMRAGEPVPEWFAFKCVIDVLQGKNA